ncbi:MAG: S8 family serine peptidase [Phycisphaeraceae bacterium]|nr:MAG: S8 family serine peptidase [Phycisphaeraceae bacterium]
MRPRTPPALSFALILLAGCAQALGDDRLAGDGPRRGFLSLTSGLVDLSATPDLLAGGAWPVRAPVVLRLDGPMTEDRRAALDRLGIKVLEYWPTECFLARVPAGANLGGLGFVVSAHAVDPAWKIDPGLGRGAYATAYRLGLSAQGLAQAVVSLHPGARPEGLLAELAKADGVRVLGVEQEGERWSVVASMAPGSAGLIAGLDDVQYVGDAPELTPRNATVRWIVQTNRTGQTPLYDHGITGVGSVIGVIDGGFDETHCAFTDPEGDPPGPNHRKIVAINQSPWPDSHGTHVAGTVLGDAGTTNDLRGVAYGAKLVFHTYPSFSETGVFNRLNLHRTQGAFTHNNSYGNDSTTAYDGICRGIDDFSWQHDDNLVVFATSNGALLKNPENAKNVLAVAATGDSGSQGTFCSGGRGPTSDGRRKPDVMTPGCGIRSASALSGCSSASSSGTSMAAPSATAVAALVREYFLRGYYPSGSPTPADGFTPSGALLKACLVNSAMDVTGIAGFPSNQEGWGRVTIDNTLYFPGDATTLVVAQARNNQPGALSTGGVVTLRFRVRSAAHPVKATLAFHDAPASLPTSFAPVNNLDLWAADGAGNVYWGNDFSGGVSRAGGAPDAINSVEQVLVAAPHEGAWAVRVLAPAVNIGSQGYGLVISGDVEPLCDADFNGDGFVDFFDADAFADAFDLGQPLADFNADGFIDFFDYDAFFGAFEAGC